MTRSSPTGIACRPSSTPARETLRSGRSPSTTGVSNSPRNVRPATRSSLLTFAHGTPALEPGKQIETPGAPTVSRATLGDVELRWRTVRSTVLTGGARQRWGVLFALKGPTAPLQWDGVGTLLPSTLQPGCGAIVPAGGLDYAVANGKWSGYGSESFWLPFALRAGPHAGDSFRASVRAQWQPLRAVMGVRAGPTLRLDTSGELAEGSTDPNSGGLVAYAATELVATPMTDLVVELGLLYPALQLLRTATTAKVRWPPPRSLTTSDPWSLT